MKKIVAEIQKLNGCQNNAYGVFEQLFGLRLYICSILLFDEKYLGINNDKQVLLNDLRGHFGWGQFCPLSEGLASL